ncbi:nuclear transport factor 2 family protein [Tateyamaria omphalii]|nr:nuclear transport factor 2 family protein [Tateyamaria omphalii]
MTLRQIVLFFGGALAMTPTASLAQTPATTAENERIITEAFETWQQGTYVFGDILSDNIVWTIHGTGPVAGVYTDFDAFIEEASRPVTSRLTAPLLPEVHHIWADGDQVIVRWDGSAPTTGGGIYENQFLWIMTMQDGLVTHAEAFLDLRAYDALVDNNEPRSE